MHPILNGNIYLIQEQIGVFANTSKFHVFDLEMKEKKMTSRSDNLITPDRITFLSLDGKTVVTVRKESSFFKSKLRVYNETNQPIGYFKKKSFSVGAQYEILNEEDQKVGEIKGEWNNWEFVLYVGDREFAKITKKWAGLGQELLTSADNYVLIFHKETSLDHQMRLFSLASVLCIDMTLKAY